MKTTRFILAALAALSIAACVKEIAPAESEQAAVKEGKTYVTVGETTLTKTVLGAASDEGVRKVFWQNGDKLNINGVASEALTDIAEGTSSVVFEFNALLDQPYKVLYPASAYKDATTVTLPSTQTYTEGSFDPAAAIALAATTSSGDAIVMKSPCAVLKLNITKGADECTLKTLTFTGKAGEQVCGDFTADFTNAALTGVSDADADKKLTVNLSSLALTSDGTDVYVVVPAGSYASGFTIRISDANGHFMDQSKTSGITLSGGKVYVLPSFSFSPAGTAVEISNAEEYLAFAAAFKAGTYGDADKDLVVNVTGDLDFNGLTFATVDNGGTYNFAGTWNGNGHLMKNITATNVPMFVLPKNSRLSGIVFDESCVITKTSSLGGHWGTIARALDAGTITDCHFNCDINIDYGAGGQLGYGAMVGRLGGTMSNCTMAGDFIHKRVASTQMSAALYVGGMVGFVNTGATMQDCTMTGNFIYQDSDLKPVDSAADLYFNIGGMVGRSNGTVKNCAMKGNVEFKEHLRNVFLGGVLGDSETANSLFDNNSFEGNMVLLQSDATTDVYKRMFVGAVIGRANAATVSNCSNVSGKTLTVETAVGTSGNLQCGGVIGCVFGATKIENCVNNMTVTLQNQSAYNCYLGGVAGHTESAANIVSAVNNGPVNINWFCGKSSANTHVGGVVGHSASPLVGGQITNKVGSIHNNAQIKLDVPEDCGNSYNALNVGGVVGRIDNNATNLTNAKKVYINLGNDGLWPGKQTGAAATQLMYIAAGGVIGRLTTASTVDGCINAGNVQFRYYGTVGNQTSRVEYVGGVVGVVSASKANAWNSTTLENSGGLAATVKNCENYAQVSESINNNSYSNASLNVGKCCGGVVGCILGKSASVKACVQNCSNLSTTAMSSSVGYFGNVVGHASMVDVTGCLNTAGASAGGTFGGIVACALNTVTIRNCVIRDCKIEKSTACGGIAGACNNAANVIEDNQVKNVTFELASNVAFGAIARNPVASTIVQNNGLSGSLKKGTADAVAFSASNAPYTYSGTFTCDASKPNYIITE